MMASRVLPTLPDDVLTLVCEVLGQQRDFSTLYRCATSVKGLADPALRTIYHLHEQSPAFMQSDELEVSTKGGRVTFAKKVAEQDLLLRKWGLLWRIIVLSSLNKTYKPYCRYLRTLDLRNLTSMLEDPKFQGKVRTKFFAGDMSPFFFAGSVANRIDTAAILQAVGESVSSKTMLLEEIAGDINSQSLPKWIARSARLKSLILWSGSALTKEAGEMIQNHAPNFKELTIRGWMEPDADQMCASFLTAMRPNTLEYFEMISFSHIGALTFEALGHHALSLKDLRISNLGPEAICNLHKLRKCTALRKLFLDDTFGVIQLAANFNDVFNETVDWLSSCKDLRDFSMRNFFDGPALLAQVLTSPMVKLTSLSLEGYNLVNHSAAAFHTSLPEQVILESLSLKGSGEDASPTDLQIMVEALCQIPTLRELELREISYDFEEAQIVSLALHLPLLQELLTGGQEVGAEVLHAFAGLKNLRSLNLYAFTQFSLDDLVAFITGLDEQTQRGFNLSVMNQDPDYQLSPSEDEQEFIRNLIVDRLEGRFDFVLWRDQDSSDSEDD